MSLAAYEISINGVLIGSGPGCAGYLTSADGLRGLPDIRTGDQPRPGDQGLLAGSDFAGGRTVTLDIEVTDNATGTKVANLAAIEAAFIHSTTVPAPLSFLLDDGSQRRIYCRTRKRATVVDVPYAGGIAKVAVQLVATDPRIYSDTQTTATTGLPDPSGASVTFPATFPLTFGSGVDSGGIVTVTNHGDFETRPLITVTGPCINPVIENVTAGQTMELDISLLTGQTLTIDFDARTVLLNGTGNVYNSLAFGSASPWFTLAPGVNEIRFESDDPSPTGATMTVAYRDAWI